MKYFSDLLLRVILGNSSNWEILTCRMQLAPVFQIILFTHFDLNNPDSKNNI